MELIIRDEAGKFCRRHVGKDGVCDRIHYYGPGYLDITLVDKEKLLETEKTLRETLLEIETVLNYTEL